MIRVAGNDTDTRSRQHLNPALFFSSLSAFGILLECLFTVHDQAHSVTLAGVNLR